MCSDLRVVQAEEIDRGRKTQNAERKSWRDMQNAFRAHKLLSRYDIYANLCRIINMVRIIKERCMMKYLAYLFFVILLSCSTAFAASYEAWLFCALLL